ncbi:P-loop containing nucleoside triphosphate hydrolase protein [Umbelopsis sp. PMI_123]|nr:P-loop containing nucleoside triphosphate hydrolase protein [Umbelopsis sp. PMI_123]
MPPKSKKAPVKVSEPPGKDTAKDRPNHGPKKRIVKNGNANSNSAGSGPTAVESERKSLFGDWTGKTPSTLLYEHCQKSQWEKPLFEVGRTKEGFVSTIVLGKHNKKTSQVDTVKMSPPFLFSPTAVEARHVAATYVLHRVNSHMPMYRILPPQHRDMWFNFDKEKTKQTEWMYSSDPFNARPSEPKKQNLVDRSISKDSESRSVPMPVSKTFGDRPREDADIPEAVRKYWESLPLVHMNADNRSFVENVIRDQSKYYPLFQDEPLKTNAEKKPVKDTLCKMGFRPAHVDESLEYCRNVDSALDWLCLHVPEDDLPSNFLSPKYNPNMTTISHTTKSLGKDWLIQRMSTLGFPSTLCENALEEADGDETGALKILLRRLLEDEDQTEIDSHPDVSEEELEAMRQDEILALESIYESGVNIKTENDNLTFEIDIKPSSGEALPTNGCPITLEIQIPKTSIYPYELPLFIIQCEALPSYIRLACMKEVMQEAKANINMPMIYMCIEYLNENIVSLIQNPPKLKDVTESFISTPATQVRKKKTSRYQSAQRKKKLTAKELAELSQRLVDKLKDMNLSDQYQDIGKVRNNLPAYNFKDKVIDAVSKHQVVIVCGETGCGKTTQVPQFILDEEIKRMEGATCNIICTQPRRISAIGVADRVATERCDIVGNTVGYSIRGETKSSSNTNLLFCTTGVLLRRIQSDPLLEGVSHIMVDEVHERSVDSDFLLVLLRDVLSKRKDIKLVLMSATINQQLFSDYFNQAPTVEIPGFTHPVTDYYLEDILEKTGHRSSLKTPKKKAGDSDLAIWQQQYRDAGYNESTVKALEPYRNQENIDYDLIANTVKYITENDVKMENGLGAILIFLPGVMEIKRCLEMLGDTLPNRSSYELFPLHAGLSSQEQARVFKSMPKNVRKIVAATNVAETSITIDGVIYVIDSGRVKETQFDASTNMMRLIETWASRASCKQRRGRAGRTRPGQCFKLYTREMDGKMQEQQTPELLRTPLEQLCLQIKAMGESDVTKFLQRAIDPPSIQALAQAITTLKNVNAIDETPEGNLTALGKHMANIPADLRISKMILFGAVFRCIDPILIIAAIMSFKSPFYSPMDQREEARKAREKFFVGNSDWLTDMKAYQEWESLKKKKVGQSALRKFCDQNFLAYNTLLEINSLKKQFLEALQGVGFAQGKNSYEEYNKNSENINLVKSIIFAGLSPNIVKVSLPDTKYDKVLSGTVEREKEAREIKFYTKDDGRVFVHPSSMLFSVTNYSPPFLTYFSKMATSKTFLRDGTEIPLYSILLFGGTVKVDHHNRGLSVGADAWIKMRAWPRIGTLVHQLRWLLNSLLDAKIEDPSLEGNA